MKRNLRVWLIIASILALTIFTLIPVFAEETTTEETVVPEPEIIPIPEDGITDNLETAEDVGWYSIELSEEGVAVLFIQSMQEHWTGYTYYWYATVYADDMKTVIAETPVKGVDNLTTLSLENLSAGTYYIKVNSSAFTNPLTAGFTSDSYNITVRKLYNSVELTYEHDGVQVFSSAYEIIGALDGTYFIKLNEGKAFSAFYCNSKGAIVPVLISENKEAVEYLVSSSGEMAVASSITIEYDGKTYYYTYADSIDKYSNRTRGSNGIPYYYSDVQTKICSDLIKDILSEKELQESGAFSYFFANYWYLLLIIPAVIGVILLLIFNSSKGKWSDDDWIHG